jgi:hypothetical protein
MNRGVVLRLILLALAILVVSWISMNTYWDKVTIPAPLRNEAARNPFYGAQRLVEQLGATSSWDRFLRDVSPDSAIVVSSWHWDLAEGRRSRMEAWVEAGGRLVLDRTLVGGEEEFERWSGITRARKDQDEEKEEDEEEEESAAPIPTLRPECRVLHDATTADRADGSASRSFELCTSDDGSHLATTRRTAWALKDDFGNQLLRVKIGKGSVTVINGVPFQFRQFLEGDNAALLIAAVQLRRNDEVHFLSEEEHPSMLALMWYLGWPVVLLALALIGLALWRSGVRFGPLIAEPDQARRSLAEQIRGTGLFVMRFGGGKALHAAAVRALNEAAGRRIGAYGRLSASERVDAVAKLTGADAGALGPAMNHGGARRPHELRQAIALIESVRRRLAREKNTGI